jgi:hypothetical protein
MPRPALNPSEYGVELNLADFKRMMWSEFGSKYAQWTVEDLLVNPREGICFCDHIRKTHGYYELPDNIILKTLLNRRKAMPSRKSVRNNSTARFYLPEQLPDCGPLPTTTEASMNDYTGIQCHDCGDQYGDPGWIEAVVPHDIWAKISPSKDEGGILCVMCIAKRCGRLGLEDVPVLLTAGPLRFVTEL